MCGRARGYQKGETYGFYGSLFYYRKTIDEDYVSGLSITYSSNPRKHIWTFASGLGERNNLQSNCPCSVNESYSLSSFIQFGNNYYCELASWYFANYNSYFLMTHYGTEQDACVDNCCDDTIYTTLVLSSTESDHKR